MSSPFTRNVLRPVTDEDLDRVLGLNADNVELLAPMDEARFHQLRGWADRFDVISLDGEFAGFVVTFAPGAAYDSENYRWFSAVYDDFYYLDRIVLLPHTRRTGIGSWVYEQLETRAAEHGRMTLEVNVEPPNEPSLAFHRRRGYVEIGRLGDDGHLVSLMVKEL